MNIGIIAKEDLLDGNYYLGESNFAYSSDKPFSTVCKWNVTINTFEFIYDSIIHTIPHYDDIDKTNKELDFFLPVQRITPINKLVLQTEKLQVV